ncbi:leucine carboxyl methyltransferase, partial [Aureobasidium melanogenum]
MSHTTIPNLNTLRRGQRGRGRGRGHPAAHSGGEGHSGRQRQDDIVQSTDNDAATSRLSAVEAGYLEDPFVRLLHPDEQVPRRLPLMNRGTYLRTASIDRIVDTFLSSTGRERKQIISLGAGSDTRYFRLKQKRKMPGSIVYHEIDFAPNTQRKIAQLRSPPFAEAAKALAGVDMHSPDVQLSEDGAILKSSEYTIHALDLRQLPRAHVDLPGVDKDLPTLIISECCLIYLSPDEADAVLRHLSQLFPSTTPLAIVIYEPIRPHDSFGRTMVSNLMSRGIQLQTLEKYSGLEEQRERLRAHGFHGDDRVSSGAEAVDIDFIWQHWTSPEEKERVDGLEWMDEVEEFVLLAKHYCISWGWRGYGEGSRWRELPTSSEKQ